MIDQQTPEPEKPSRVVTVRMSDELHDHLKRTAWKQKVSLNKFCVNGLRQLVGEHVPASGSNVTSG